MKLSSIIINLLLSLLLGMVAFIYLYDGYPPKIYYYIFGLFLIGLVIVYILQAEIDWYWSLRHPPEMPAPLERQLGTVLPYYRQLDGVEKKRFRDRCMLWVQSREHLLEGLEDFPQEVKHIIASQVVMMTFGLEKYLLLPYDRIVLYPHPFPTPSHAFLHHSETHDGDGVMIFNVNPLMSAIHKPREYYNLVLHEYGHAFIQNHPEAQFPVLNGEDWEKLASHRGFGLARAQQCVGMPELQPQQVMLEYFFTIPHAFQQELPEAYAQLCQVLNQDPLQAQRPVRDIHLIGENPLKGV